MRAVRHLVLAVLPIWIACSAEVVPVAVTPASITVTPATATVAAGLKQQLAAAVTMSDGSPAPATTPAVTWRSSDEQVATVDQKGLVTTLAKGTATVSAKLGTLTGSATITVTEAALAKLDLESLAPTAAAGLTVALLARGTYTDATTKDLTPDAAWTSDAEAIATVSTEGPTKGVVTGHAVGTALIHAKVGTIDAAVSVTITDPVLQSIVVTPDAPKPAKGTTVQLSAKGVYSDGSNQDLTSTCAWTSSAADLARVSDASGTKGLVAAQAEGSAIIQAASGTISGATVVTVAPAALTSIVITPALLKLPKGTSAPLTAIGIYSDGTTQDLTPTATWSAPGTVLTVSNGSTGCGVVTGVNPGSAVVTAKSGEIEGSVAVEVTAAALVALSIDPPEVTLAGGLEQRFVATGVFTDGVTADLSSDATWTSDATAVVTVSNNANSMGRATAVAAGSARVTATVGSVSAHASVKVTTATLTVITVSPIRASIPAGERQQFLAVGRFSDGTQRDVTRAVRWTSSNTAVGDISNDLGTEGTAISYSAGATTMTATLGAITGTATLTVTDAAIRQLIVAPATVTLAAGTSVILRAVASWGNGTRQDVTGQASWVSSNPAVAVVTSGTGARGYVSGISAGSVVITATYHGYVDTMTATVTAATVTALALEPLTQKLATGTYVGLRAQATFSDGSTQDVTGQASWVSADPSIAPVSTGIYQRAQVYGASAGTTAITGSFGGLSKTVTVTVNAATLVSMVIDPATPSIVAGRLVELQARGTFSDGSRQFLRRQVIWTSSNDAVAIVSNAVGSQGYVLGVSAGTATITATRDAVTATTTVTVNAAP